jgi:hypothetical protein
MSNAWPCRSGSPRPHPSPSPPTDARLCLTVNSASSRESGVRSRMMPPQQRYSAPHHIITICPSGAPSYRALLRCCTAGTTEQGLPHRLRRPPSASAVHVRMRATSLATDASAENTSKACQSLLHSEASVSTPHTCPRCSGSFVGNWAGTPLDCWTLAPNHRTATHTRLHRGRVFCICAN